MLRRCGCGGRGDSDHANHGSLGSDICSDNCLHVDRFFLVAMPVLFLVAQHEEYKRLPREKGRSFSRAGVRAALGAVARRRVAILVPAVQSGREEKQDHR
jgi:hypothetical protein